MRLQRRAPPAIAGRAVSAVKSARSGAGTLFPAAFTFARRMYDALPVMFDHQWCGVTQLGWDEKSAHKIAQMLALNLPRTSPAR